VPAAIGNKVLEIFHRAAFRCVIFPGLCCRNNWYARVAFEIRSKRQPRPGIAYGGFDSGAIRRIEWRLLCTQMQNLLRQSDSEYQRHAEEDYETAKQCRQRDHFMQKYHTPQHAENGDKKGH
jgi:hypothetical protein